MRLAFLCAIFICSCSAFAQRTIPLRNLWAEPHVHVLFDGYLVSFTVKDINRAIQILNEAGDTTYGTTSGLDTAKQYSAELYAGYNTDYQSRLQPLLHDGVGAYLLSVGHADILDPRGKKLKNVVIDSDPYDAEGHISDVKFYDTKSGKLLFNGLLPEELRNKDIGID